MAQRREFGNISVRNCREKSGEGEKRRGGRKGEGGGERS